MKPRVLPPTMIVAALGMAGTSNAQVRITHTASVSAFTELGRITNFGDNPRIVKTTTAPSFVCGDTFTIHLVRAASVGTARANEFRFAAHCSSFPAGWVATKFDILPNTAVTPVTNSATATPMEGPLIGVTIPANATWEIEYGLDFDDFPASNAPGMTIDRLDFTIQSGSIPSTPFSPRVLSFPGTMFAIDYVGSGLNTVLTTSNPTSSALLFNGTVYLRNPSIIGRGDTTLYYVLEHSAYPQLPIVFRSENPIRSNIYLPFGVEFPKLAAVTTSLTGTVIPPGGTWTLEAGWATTLTSTSSHENMTIGLQGTTFSVGHTGTLVNAPVTDLARDLDNAVINLGASTGAFTLSPRIVIREGFMTRQAPSAGAIQARIRLRNSAYPCAFLDFQPNTTSFGADGVIPVSARTQTIAGYGTGTALTSQSMVGYVIPSGSTWTAEPFTTTDTRPGQVESEFSYLKFFLLNEGPTVATTSFTSSSTNMGEWHAGVGSLEDPASYLVGILNSGVVHWRRFTLANGLASNQYLDVWTDRTLSAATTNPALALYASNGMLIAHDADDDSDQFAALTFGTVTNPRPANGNGLQFNGRDADCLEPGTYYLAYWPAAGSYSMDNGFSIGGIATTGSGLGGRILMRTNIPGPALSISGNVQLTSLADPASIATDRLLLQAFNSSGALVGTATSAISPTGAYALSMNLPGAGNYVFKASTRTSLNKSVARSVGTVPITQNWNLTNGNADRDEDNNEIGPGDLQIILDNFGIGSFETRSDLDKDGECGPGDLQIVLDNFGLEGD